MLKRSECIRARGELEVEVGAEMAGPDGMPMPCRLATYVLSVSPAADGSEGAGIVFRVRSAAWTWVAVTVEWRYQTASWLHFGGTGGVNGRWPCVYRAGVRFDRRGRVTRVVLHGYAIEARGSVTSAFEMSTPQAR